MEDRIDLELLKANATGILIELELKRTWQFNPLLYLKTAFIGLDHALNKPAVDAAGRMDRTFSRLAAIPGLLQQSVDNIRTVPQTYHDAARSMLVVCRRYIDYIGRKWPTEDPIFAGAKLHPYLERAETALGTMANHLNQVSIEPRLSVMLQSWLPQVQTDKNALWQFPERYRISSIFAGRRRIAVSFDPKKTQ